jgi:alkylation response protein AidB-like acyl-CoA dehydrogenase
VSALLETLSPDEREMVTLVADWVDNKVNPVVREVERSGEYPTEMIADMKRMGVYGLLVPQAWGGVEVSVPCFALVTEELARGWMSLAGAMGGHSVVVELIRRFGTPAQQGRWLPLLATGEVRATMALTEPSGGSDLQAMLTTARLEGDRYVVNGSKTWITNAEKAGVVALLCKTDPDAMPRHRGISVLLCEKGPGFEVGRSLPKLGYKGVESCELFFDGYETPADTVLGERPGEGFSQMMQGLEVGRIQVAARATGVARAAFDAALAYSQERTSFGKPIWQHQAVGNHLADMGTKLTAARSLLMLAARTYQETQSANLEAGMAKLFASEVCAEVSLSAIRVHGGIGYSTDLDVERYYRDAPLMIVGEGTNEIQRNLVARQLIERGLP